MSVIEAFALGKPVIGANIGGIPELVKVDETGLLFEPFNANDLASKMGHLIDEPALVRTMGENARQFVEDELNPEKHYTKLMQIYEAEIANHQ